MPITVVTIDDHPLIRAAVRSLLAAHSEVELVAEGYVGDHALQLVEKYRPNIVLLDIAMPQTEDKLTGERFSVLKTVARLNREYPETSVIFLTQYASQPMSQQAVALGVRGYLLKSDDLSMNLSGAIETVHHGGVFFSKEISSLLFQPTQNAMSPLLLSERQIEIIQTIAQNPDSTYQQLAYELSITESTLKGHLNKAFKVLDVTNITACIITCMQKGFIPFTIDELGHISFG